MKTLFTVLVLTLLITLCHGAAAPATVQLAHFEQAQLDAFLVPFRETVLHMVAVAWNHTIGESTRLQVDLHHCSDQLKSTVETCKACATAECTQDTQTIQHSPTFTDYLNVALQLANPINYLKEPLNEIGDRLEDLVDLLGDGSSDFIHSISGLGETVGGAFSDAFHGVEAAANAVKDSLVLAGNSVIGGITDVGNTIGNVGNTIGDGFSSAGNAIKDVGQSVIDGIGSIFGRKREAIKAELQKCMQPCPSCSPLLMPTQRDVVTSVCGEDVVLFNDTVRSHVIMVKGVFASVSDKQHPVIVNIQYDPASQKGLTYTTMYVTANIKGHYVRYRSNVVYDLINVGTTAAKVAVEFWQLWLQ